MFKGRNKMLLNHATMKLAVEQYLNARVREGEEVAVVDLAYDTNAVGGPHHVITVEQAGPTETTD